MQNCLDIMREIWHKKSQFYKYFFTWKEWNSKIKNVEIIFYAFEQTVPIYIPQTVGREIEKEDLQAAM